MRWERGAVCLGPACYPPHSCSGDPASAWSRAPGSARKLAIPLSCLVLLAPPAQGQQLCLGWPSDPRCQVFAERLSGTNCARPQGQRPLRPGPCLSGSPSSQGVSEGVGTEGQCGHRWVCNWVQWLGPRMSGRVTAQRTQFLSIGGRCGEKLALSPNGIPAFLLGRRCPIST